MPCVLTCFSWEPEGAGELLAGLCELPASYSIRLFFAYVNRQNQSWNSGLYNRLNFSGRQNEPFNLIKQGTDRVSRQIIAYVVYTVLCKIDPSECDAPLGQALCDGIGVGLTGGIIVWHQHHTLTDEILSETIQPRACTTCRRGHNERIVDVPADSVAIFRALNHEDGIGDP